MKTVLSRKSRGSALVMNLLAVAVFALLGVVVFRAVRTQVGEVIYHQRLAQSFYIAEAGLEDAMRELSNNLSWRAGFARKDFAGGYYTVVVSTESPPLISSTGYSRPIALFGRAHTTVSATAQITYSTATAVYAIMADTLARVEGPAPVDAYYLGSGLEPQTFSFGAGIWSNGDVAVTTGAAVNGNVYYRGSAAVDPGTVYGSLLRVTDTQTLSNNTCGACKRRNDNLTITPASCYNPSTMDLVVSTGAVCTMRAGTYYFENITVNGTLNVQISTAPAVVFFASVMNVGTAGAVNNQSKIPSFLSFYGERKGQAHTFASAVPMHAYLEEASGSWDIRGPLYGHIWGKTVVVRGTGAVHAEIGGPSPNAALRVAWKKPTWARGKKKN